MQHIRTGHKEHPEAQHTSGSLQWHSVLGNSPEKTADYQKHSSSGDITVPVSAPAHGENLEAVGTPAGQHTKMPPMISLKVFWPAFKQAKHNPR